MAQGFRKMAARSCKMAEDGLKMPSWTPHEGPRRAQDGPKVGPWPQDSPTRPQDRPRFSALFWLMDRIFAPRRHKMADDGHKMAPR